MKNSAFKISLLFALVGIAAGGLLGMYQVETLAPEMKRLIIAKLGSTGALVLLSALQTAVYAFVSAFLGLKIAGKVHLKLGSKLNLGTLLGAVLIGALTAFIIAAFDKFVFAAYLPKEWSNYRFSWLYLASGVLYGGIIEELMLRLFFISLIVLILQKVFAGSGERGPIPSWIYYTAIFIAALFFGAAHLPATAQLLGLSAPIVIRALLLNGVAGIGYGFLFWKRGLAAAICAHVLTHIFNQLVFMPLFFS